VAGDITCKACVIQLYTYLESKGTKDEVWIALRDKGNIILNESSLNYLKSQLPQAQFTFLSAESFFPRQEKYPYLLIVNKSDSVKIGYDSLFIGEHLNLRYLK
jgi:hypothetical protein